MRRLTCLLLLSLICSFGCRLRRSHDAAAVKSGQQQSADIDSRTLQFGMDFYKAAKRQYGGDGNFFFSPLSMTIALRMLHAGAKGETARQIGSVLQTGGNDDLSAALRPLLQKLQAASNEQTTLTLNNTAWIEESFPVVDSFKSALVAMPSDVVSARFLADPDGQRKKINEEIAARTQQMITELLAESDVNALVRFVLTNTLYFKGAWQKPFKPADTKAGDFVVSSERAVKVPLMQTKAMFKYFENELVRGIELPYGESGEFSMLLLLPSMTKQQIDRVDEQLLASDLQNWLRNAEVKNIDLKLPKFKAGGDVSASDVLKSMGIEDVFVDGKADLTGISAAGGLFVSQVAHQAKLVVDEQGTTAAAATAVVGGIRSAPVPQEIKEFYLDKPFLLVVLYKGPEDASGEQAFGVPLFLGRISDPTL